MITIPLLGQINASVDVAPFQFAPSNPNLGLPMFGNSTNHINYADFAAGYWGLTSFYTSISQWKGNGTYNDQMVQDAGSVITPFGIFDNDQTLPNPAEYNPVLNTYNGYASSIWCQQSPTRRYNTTLQASGANGPLLRYLTTFPNLLFESQKVPFRVAQVASFTYPYSVVGYGSLQPLSGFVGLDIVLMGERQFDMGVLYLTGGSSEVGTPALLPGMYFYPDAGCGNSTLSNFKSYQPQEIYNLYPGPHTKVAAAALSFGLGIGFFPGALVNPRTGNAFCTTSTNFGFNPPFSIFPGDTGSNVMLSTNVFFTPKINGSGQWTGAIVLQETKLSNPADQEALYNPPSNPTYTACVTPQGHFLFRPYNYSYTPYYFLMASDFSGYYRIAFNAKSSAAETAISIGGSASTGFGVDIGGNIWWGGAAAFLPTLYSTLGLGWNINLAGFPSVTTNALACKLNNGRMQLAWEG